MQGLSDASVSLVSPRFGAQRAEHRRQDLVMRLAQHRQPPVIIQQADLELSRGKGNVLSILSSEGLLLVQWRLGSPPARAPVRTCDG